MDHEQQTKAGKLDAFIETLNNLNTIEAVALAFSTEIQTLGFCGFEAFIVPRQRASQTSYSDFDIAVLNGKLQTPLAKPVVAVFKTTINSHNRTLQIIEFPDWFKNQPKDFDLWSFWHKAQKFNIQRAWLLSIPTSDAFLFCLCYWSDADIGDFRASRHDLHLRVHYLLDTLVAHHNSSYNKEEPLYSSVLTNRETEVLHWCAAGKTNWEIGKILDVSENTIRFHLKNIFKKFDVSTRQEAATVGLNLGLIFDNKKGRRSLIQRSYRSFIEGNPEPLLSILDEDVQWVATAPTDLFPHAGHRRGIPEVVEYLQTIGTIYEPKRFLPRMMVEEKNQIAVYLDVELIERATGNRMYFDVAHFWTFRKEKVVHYLEIFNSSLAHRQSIGELVPD